MAITITKPKQKKEVELPKVETEAFVDPSELTLEQLADKYGDLTDQVAALQMNPAFTQLAEVTKQLNERMAELEPLDTATVTGERWLVEVGVAAKNARRLKSGAVPVLQTLLGAETFGKIAKVNISDVEKYCTPDQVAKVVDDDTGYSNKRKITAKHIA